MERHSEELHQLSHTRTPLLPEVNIQEITGYDFVKEAGARQGKMKVEMLNTVLLESGSTWSIGEQLVRHRRYSRKWHNATRFEAREITAMRDDEYTVIW
jgi:hypothetical protein